MNLNRLLVFLALLFSFFSQSQALEKNEKLNISSVLSGEYNFVPTKKGAFFLSNRNVAGVAQVKDGKNENLSRIFYASKVKNKYARVKPVDIKFYNHIGSFSVNSAGSMIVFTGRQSKFATTYGLFKTEKIKGKWSTPSLVFNQMEQFNFTDPFISRSGDTLYFASDLAGGKGGLDLYKATGSAGNWMHIENLGSFINTAGNERFPSLREGTFYFSSQRENGMGGMDIFSNSIENSTFSKSVLLAAPVNSASDDFSVSWMDGTLFFASNRDGTDDIYELKIDFPEFDCVPEQPLERCYEFSDEFSDFKDSIQYDYRWNMGDGTVYKGITAEHCYADTGTFVVELGIYELQTNEMVSSLSTYELTVEDPFQLELQFPEQWNKGIPFEFKVKNDGQADSSKFYWNFGDGFYVIGESVSHSYFQSGTFTILVGRIYYIRGEEFRMCTSRKIKIL